MNHILTVGEGNVKQMIGELKDSNSDVLWPPTELG